MANKRTKSSSSKGKRKTSGSTSQKGKKKTAASSTSAEEKDTVSVDILLWSVLAVSILLFLSAIGFGGAIGGAVSYVLFGLFGLVTYFIPFILVIGTFFGVSNRQYIRPLRVLIAGVVFTIFLSALMELITNSGVGSYGPVYAFFESSENKTGGGFFGGLIAYLFVHGFGLVGAYVLVLVGMIICILLITRRSVFQEYMDDADHRQAQRSLRRQKRAEHAAALRAGKERFGQGKDDNRQAERLEKTRAGRRQPKEPVYGQDVPRAGRKRFGVGNTTLLTPEKKSDSDEMNEITAENLSDSRSDTIERVTRETVAPSRFGNGSDRKSASAAESAAPHNERTIHIAGGEEPSVSKETPASDVIPKTMNAAAPNSQDHSSDTMPEQNAKPSESFRSKKSGSSPDASSASSSAKPTASAAAAETAAAAAAAATAGVAGSAAGKRTYRFPPVSLLKELPHSANKNTRAALSETAEKLEQTLINFGVNAKVTDVRCGPTVTQFEVQPEMGVSVRKILNLENDLKYNLAATDIRIEAPIPGKSAVGIEVPNKETVMVSFRELVESKEFKASKSKISFAAGRDISGSVIMSDVAKMPHLLIAGATGSGKSVCINTIIMSILYKARPDEVKFIMIDPKVVELSAYNGIPHLLIPVVTDVKKAAGALNWAVHEMDERYKKFAELGVRNISGYNSAVKDGFVKVRQNGEDVKIAAEKMPQMVIIVDELADLMMVARKEVEDSICRLAQLARACGIHLIIATQRPSVDVITGLIKANMPSRIAFSVSSGVDSRTILDMTGAEKLLGKGDMLYFPQGLPKPIRVQGAFVSDDEVSRVVDFLKQNNDKAAYNDQIEEKIKASMESSANASVGGATVDDDRDVFFADAGRLVIEAKSGSTGMLQRKLKVGFNRGARILDQLEEAGVVGPPEGTKPRKVLMNMEQFEEVLSQSQN